MALVDIQRELQFLGFRGRFSRMVTNNSKDGKSMLIEIKGLSRFKSLTDKEILALQTKTPYMHPFYIERSLFGVKLWRSLVLNNLRGL